MTIALVIITERAAQVLRASKELAMAAVSYVEIIASRILRIIKKLPKVNTLSFFSRVACLPPGLDPTAPPNHFPTDGPSIEKARA